MKNTKGEGQKMTDEKLVKATEEQIEMVDKLIEGLIREFQNYVDPEDEQLVASPDLNDALVAVNIKERLLRARRELRSSPLRNNLFWGQGGVEPCKVNDSLDMENPKPEVTT